MTSVLLPTDFSDNSWNAIKYALEFLKDKKCVFYILHINTLSFTTLNDPSFIASESDINDIYIKPSKVKLRSILKRISQFSNTNLHKFYTVVDYGFFIDSIRKQVVEKNIDLIVMGTKGASGLKQIIIGSNAGDVVVKVKCPTLVVPEDCTYKHIEEIAFPTDFSSFNSFNTLKPLLSIIEAFNAKLSFLHVTKSKPKLNYEQQKNKDILEDFFTDFNTKCYYLTNTHLEEAIQCFIESRGVDMIAMVAKNLNYFQQILFHTRVEKITYHTEIPFLVLHEKT
ncbi:nucleotide-binding universal stress UspA family protein [Winogradskyella wandonensis]|uniref:Nucleotide-binding universal stress UspA family protein n=1 Tax=Winogradskyella wandonensis TaxID=1442586 RepID=A0A4R1KLX7_9FLAO|nr:universal stress protein [Winogradskyella wandonensis]TCK64819.1 nucleotide-binding universal stress UspA family protein [Winogradskyella wandonensis]